MKKIILCLMVALSLLCIIGYAEAQFDNAVLEINSVDGGIVVSGSFDSTTAEGNYKVMLATYSENNTLVKLDISQVMPILEGTNTFTLNADIIHNVQKTKAFVWTDDMTPICPATEKTIYSLKVLAIGNSFSVDAMQWLYNIADNAGIDNIVLGNLYIGGCTLETHWKKASGNSSSYTYYKNTTGEWTTSKSKSIKHALNDENWNLITLQQASGSSGMPDTYEPYLTNLIEYVNTNKTNPYAKIAWHMTWAYKQNSSHSEFSKYNKDQLTMYNAIVSTLKEKVLSKAEFAYYIPSGTAIQNVRTSLIGDNVTRDGYHLSYQLGRYIAGMTWFHKITGLPVDDITYVPDVSAIPTAYLAAVKECVTNAVTTPDQVTQSQHTEKDDTDSGTDDGSGDDTGSEEVPEYDFSSYDLLEWTPTGSAFYNSTSSSTMQTTENSSASNLKYFIATKIFTKEELPNGTLIVIDSGYQYRPEGWTALDKKNSSSKRPGNVTTNVVEVTDAWWGDFNYRAFNISVVGSKTNISSKVEETASHFKIYIPKSE